MNGQGGENELTVFSRIPDIENHQSGSCHFCNIFERFSIFSWVFGISHHKKRIHLEIQTLKLTKYIDFVDFSFFQDLHHALARRDERVAHFGYHQSIRNGEFYPDTKFGSNRLLLEVSLRSCHQRGGGYKKSAIYMNGYNDRVERGGG